MIRKYVDKENKFIEIFNDKNGFYMRTGILNEEGKDTNVDPFMRNFPNLIDIGIMSTCIHGKTGLCIQSGVECYQDGLNIAKPNMSLGDFKKIADECKGKVFSFALGGRGDPNKHENFKEIMEYCREVGIVPNYTTSGLDLTDEEIQVTKETAGAVAVSWYRSDHTLNAIERFIKAGVKTNIHYVLGNNSIDEAIQRLKEDSFPKGINAVIFLMHKPVGLGSEKNVLKVDDPRVKEFAKLIDGNTFRFKIGFDSCSSPLVTNFMKNIDTQSMDACEGGRYSMYITAEMEALPCSFDNQDLKYKVDLRENTIKEAWESEEFNQFRNYLRHSCKGCGSRENCLGGCPLVNVITLCDRTEREFTNI